MKKTFTAIGAAVLIGLTACSTPAPPNPSPTSTLSNLTEDQQKLHEYVGAELDETAWSEQKLVDHLVNDDHYTASDVKIVMDEWEGSIDWSREAAEMAEIYGITDKAEIKQRLIADGFTEEQAQFGAYPISQE